MSVQAECRAFMAANDKSPVVAGSAVEPDARKPSRGAIYDLQDGSSHRLSFEACRALPKGYPRWVESD